MRNYKPRNVADNVMNATNRSNMDKWHHGITQVSGTMVLAFGNGLSRDAADAMVTYLHTLADNIAAGLGVDATRAKR